MSSPKSQVPAHPLRGLNVRNIIVESLKPIAREGYRLDICLFIHFQTQNDYLNLDEYYPLYYTGHKLSEFFLTKFEKATYLVLLNSMSFLLKSNSKSNNKDTQSIPMMLQYFTQVPLIAIFGYP